MAVDLNKRFQEIYQANQDRIYRLCRAYLKDETAVHDLFQEVWIRVWQNLPGFRGEAAAGTWVYRIAVNTALLWRKKIAKRRQQEITDATSLDLALDTTYIQEPNKEDQLQSLLQAIMQLKAIDRLVITMVLEGFQYAEIAETTGLKANHVGVKVNRIKKRLQKDIQKRSSDGNQ